MVHWRVAHSAEVEFVLSGEGIETVDGQSHSVHGEEGGQVGHVHGSHCKGEEPPETPQYSPTQGLRLRVHTCSRTQNARCTIFHWSSIRLYFLPEMVEPEPFSHKATTL